MMLTMKEAAAELRVSQQWLKYWLVENPIDTDGLALYVPMGKRWKFHPTDLERILNHMRKLEAARLGPSIKSKVRLIGLMSQLDGSVTYEDRLRMREAKKRPTPPTNLIAELAVESVLGPRPPRRPRARLPRFKRPSTP